MNNTAKLSSREATEVNSVSTFNSILVPGKPFTQSFGLEIMFLLTNRSAGSGLDFRHVAPLFPAPIGGVFPCEISSSNIIFCCSVPCDGIA